MYRSEGMYSEECLCSTVLKAYQMLVDWHRESAANPADLTPYRGYYNRLKDGGIVSFSDSIEDCNGKTHIFSIEELQII